MFKRIFGAIVLGLVFVLTGCAGFKENALKEVDDTQFTKAPVAKTKIYVRWDFATESGTKNDQANTMQLALHKKYFEDALAASNCCLMVETAKDADVVVEGTTHDENSKAAIIPAMITGFSLFVIPSWVTINIHVTATAKSAVSTKSYDLKDSMTMVQWLPMVLAMPFSENPIKSEKHMTENAYKTLVMNMRTDGLIK